MKTLMLLIRIIMMSMAMVMMVRRITIAMTLTMIKPMTITVLIHAPAVFMKPNIKPANDRHRTKSRLFVRLRPVGSPNKSLKSGPNTQARKNNENYFICSVPASTL